MALILVGHEESQAVTIALRENGHEAYSCDLKPCSGGFPEYHLQMDVFKAVELRKWDAGIFFPDCTYLTSSAEWAYKDGPYHQKVKPGTLTGAARRIARTEAVNHVVRLWNCGIEKISIENPVGHLSSAWKKPTQLIQPYEYGADASKRTCLWLKGLPELKPTLYIQPRIVGGRERWGNQTDSGQNKITASVEDRAGLRAKTYPGIAKAMADQWFPKISNTMKKAFKTYFGGKESPGVYQTIINHIRPHRFFAEPFGGNYTVSRMICEGAAKYINDADPEVFRHYPASCAPWIFMNWDYKPFCDGFLKGPCGHKVIYFDPPYPLLSRKSSRKVYRYEMTDQQHEEFLHYAGSIKDKADILISTYPNDLYKEKLSDWYHIEFNGCDRHGKTTEWLFMNYDRTEIVELHDSQYYGEGCTERQRIARHIKNTVRKIQDHPDPIIRAEILKQIKAL